ncbi:hypothetical protein WI80_00035 [Burkholderia ubonensis]|uniref:T6SS effector phospholipase Tle3 domain-containing protein n=1 Tax=Burkholderia ubonensis TaxID=101571 RepID=UPI0007565012|nr:hypothetical protein [Burkholderia ubonensis]KVD16050.1 hypothetical protein WI80_00035 [Burkholderia ubonensis]KVU24918.1 hypothetical protein WK63_25325 [Burkholderia ubonensis]
MPTSQRSPVASAKGTVLPDKQKKLIAVKPMPLPGVVIFVHGVNSEGEWFGPAEQGLCRGLNRRLGRLDDQMMFKGPDGGQLTPATYIKSLTKDGFINPKMTPQTYVQPDPSWSPVIHFRWGHKANKEELQEFGGSIFLNEQNYWGGGPFANGCSSLPDLWNAGVNDRLFLWLSIQDMNPVDARMVYSTPSRQYGVMAALRLAKLIESIRKKQADCPITVVCHSQGNMVGLTAAFLGDQLPDVKDGQGKSGRCVADAYVLANAPYSLVAKLGTDSWAQRGVKDSEGRRGRQTWEARVHTLSNFFDIIRARAALEPTPADIDEEMANTRTSASGKSYSAVADREAHGLKVWGQTTMTPAGYGNTYRTYGRVTLYCCPHDQVVSATTVQGIGWRGLTAYEIEVTGGADCFTQRVFASGYLVGQAPGGYYDYTKNDWRYQKGKTQGFWYPPSPKAKFSIIKSLTSRTNLRDMIGIWQMRGLGPIINMAGIAVNATPPEWWAIPIDAPKLDHQFTPVAMKYGKPIAPVHDGPAATSLFNEGNDPTAAARDKHKSASEKKPGDAIDDYKGATPIGNEDSEADLRYEMHAVVRQTVRHREQGNSALIDADGNVVSEQPGFNAGGKAKQYSSATVTSYLGKTEKNNPTNHSTIMTNADHAEHALAYDVAIGVCRLTPDDWAALRLEADWRFGGGLDKSNPHKKYAEYFNRGKMNNEFLSRWIKTDSEAHMPKKIQDERDGGMFLEVAQFL